MGALPLSLPSSPWPGPGQDTPFPLPRPGQGTYSPLPTSLPLWKGPGTRDMGTTSSSTRKGPRTKNQGPVSRVLPPPPPWTDKQTENITSLHLL